MPKSHKTTITENQFWQLVGLITAGRDARKMQETLEKAYCEITSEEYSYSRFTDHVWEDYDIVTELIKTLPYDNVEIKKGRSKVNEFWRRIKAEEKSKNTNKENNK